MKRVRIFFFGLLLLLTSGNVRAQPNQPVAPKMPLDEKTGLITYSSVIEVKGHSAGDLYKRALSWAGTFYKNPSDVIRERDSINGRIVCKARFKIMNPADKKGITTDAGNVMYSLRIQFKEGRYRYELSEINWKQPSYYPCERWMDRSSAAFSTAFDHYLFQTDQTLNSVLKDLQKAMSSPEASPSGDW